ncbi:MAG: glycerophosphodiester phosphodiesterase, partial [Candidatus Omnitrophica bacterium]|nr:glycerophosphodiester phosphodiesterase [Candidatus Omnitrophota bacterium]
RRQPQRSLRQAIRLRCHAWHPHVSVLTRARVAAAQAAGLRVNVWTVDSRRYAKRLMAWGVDGIFTNHPARLRQ